MIDHREIRLTWDPNHKAGEQGKNLTFPGKKIFIIKEKTSPIGKNKKKYLSQEILLKEKYLLG